MSETTGARGALRDAIAAWEAYETSGADLPDALVFAGGRARKGKSLKGAVAEAAAAKQELFHVEASETKITRVGGMVYVPRMLGAHHDVAVLRKCRETGTFVLLYGPPGTGKTAMAEAAFNGDLYTLSGSGDTETADFVGTFFQKDDGNFEWADGPLIRAMEEGKPFLIDECALIDPKAMAVVYSAMDGRGEVVVTANPKRGVVKAKPGFYVVGAFNPNAPGARVSEALLSRFTLQIEVNTDYDLAKTLGVSSKFITVAKNLDTKRRSGEIMWSPQLRECLAFRQISELLGEEVALANVLSTCPEEDRSVVSDALNRQYGTRITTLELGAQV
jgi:DNA polymerase III delta prime subunit